MRTVEDKYFTGSEITDVLVFRTVHDGAYNTIFSEEGHSINFFAITSVSSPTLMRSDGWIGLAPYSSNLYP